MGNVAHVSFNNSNGASAQTAGYMNISLSKLRDEDSRQTIGRGGAGEARQQALCFQAVEPEACCVAAVDTRKQIFWM